MHACSVQHGSADLVIEPVHGGYGVEIPAVNMNPGGVQTAAQILSIYTILR